ncbi:uncharacterized protein LOC125738137 [Brienomyrus brachyistius]|uniref:uncharacterized protein LOC125738137 n=1 Tax=Brienomyrus brachyistius TaxID=42636 RepID=UPI0020B42BFB|nr:uncharacterized protein LOC125738137 [Brienomyrus brachyistius]
MDLHVPAAAGSRYGGGWAAQNGRGNTQNRTRPAENEGLQFLSREERECIRFLEETIESLDEDLDEADGKRLSGAAEPAVHRPITAATVMMSGRSVNPKDQDIIDLVQKQPKAALYSSVQQDFRSMSHPETHFEMKAKPDPLGNLPYDLKLPPTVTPSAANNNPNATSQPQYQPAGFVPTPVIIAQKLAAHQRAAGVSLPSTILSNSRRSLDSNPQDQASTTAKPSYYPDNISVIMGGKQTDALPPINVQERKAQVLTHLTGPLQLEETGTKNTPIRSSSYRDPTQDRTRMEALSKLGLNADQPSSSSYYRAANQSVPSKNKADSSLTSSYAEKSQPLPLSLTSSAKTTPSATDFNNYLDKSKSPKTRSSSMLESRGNINATPDSAPSLTDFNNYGGKTKIMSLVSSVKSNTAANPHISHENRPSMIPPPSGPVVSTNSFGGKSRFMVPPTSSKTEPDARLPIPSGGVNNIGITSNSYGGKSKVMNPSMSTAAVPEIVLRDSYGAKNKTVSPAVISVNRPEASASNPNQNVPVTTPRPAYALPNASLGPLASRSEPVPSDATGLSHQSSGDGATAGAERQLSFSKPAAPLRPQGITVQFTGRGPTDQSRKEALRVLGLLKKGSGYSS